MGSTAAFTSVWGNGIMAEVNFSIPRKHVVRNYMLSHHPVVYEWLQAKRWTLKDRVLWLRQGNFFDRLAKHTAQPSHIEVETISRCNGTCAFCPVNRFVDPRENVRMTEELFKNIIDELKEWKYTGTLNLFSNNEPFLDKRIFDFLIYAREQLPDAYIQIISNGTPLTPEKAVAALEKLSNMVINNYATEYVLHANVQQIVDHLNSERPDLAGKLTVGYRKIMELKSNRAGNAPNRRRRETTYRSRCAYPFFQMVIRPDGKVSMCCNDALGQMTLGDVARDGVRKAWASPERLAFQRKMLKRRDTIELCSTCDNLAWANPNRVAKNFQLGAFDAE